MAFLCMAFLCMALPNRSIVLCGGEKSQSQTLDREQPVLFLALAVLAYSLHADLGKLAAGVAACIGARSQGSAP